MEVLLSTVYTKASQPWSLVVAHATSSVERAPITTTLSFGELESLAPAVDRSVFGGWLSSAESPCWGMRKPGADRLEESSPDVMLIETWISACGVWRSMASRCGRSEI